MGKVDIIETPIKSVRVGDLVIIDHKLHLVLETEHGTLGNEEYIDLTFTLEVTPDGLVHQGRRFDPSAIVSVAKKKPVVRKWWQFWKR